MLDRETLGLTFAVGSRGIHVLVLDPVQGLDLRSLDTEGHQVGDLVTRLFRGLDPRASRKTSIDLDRDVDELSRRLLGTVTDRLDRFRRLAIVADGPMERLPFELLRHPRTRRRLVETHEIVYLPSFSVLVASRARSGECLPAPARLLAMGDPIFGPKDDRWPSFVDSSRNAADTLALHRLPATADEVRTLEGIYTKGVSIALGAEATRERFLAQAPEHRVIHVATHARSDSEVPEHSRIALSCLDAEGRVPETCDVYFADVVNLDLCGQVVVLSACDTAGGRQVAGEGTLGLPRAFLHSGASAVVASLWPVADKPAAALMSVFHRHLEAGTTPGEALHKAKLERINAGEPPSAWAAFILLGDG